MKGAFLPRGMTAEKALYEVLDFIQIMEHDHGCIHFGPWSCGQRGILDKYRPNHGARKTSKHIHKYRRTKGRRK